MKSYKHAAQIKGLSKLNEEIFGGKITSEKL